MTACTLKHMIDNTHTHTHTHRDSYLMKEREKRNLPWTHSFWKMENILDSRMFRTVCTKFRYFHWSKTPILAFALFNLSISPPTCSRSSPILPNSLHQLSLSVSIVFNLNMKKSFYAVFLLSVCPCMCPCPSVTLTNLWTLASSSDTA
jgi:hypothetical protein